MGAKLYLVKCVDCAEQYSGKIEHNFCPVCGSASVTHGDLPVFETHDPATAPQLSDRFYVNSPGDGVLEVNCFYCGIKCEDFDSHLCVRKPEREPLKRPWSKFMDARFRDMGVMASVLAGLDMIADRIDRGEA